jgi:hypothetical protein
MNREKTHLYKKQHQQPITIMTLENAKWVEWTGGENGGVLCEKSLKFKGALKFHQK